MIKMIIRLPLQINADAFAELATTIVLGRYGKNGYYNGLAAPRVTWLRMGAKTSTAYAIDATEIDPAFVSAVEYLGQFIPLKFYFDAEGRALSENWWRPASKYFEYGGYYNNDIAEFVEEEWCEKLAEVSEVSEVSKPQAV